MERKTHTSTAVKQRYLDKTYDVISFRLPKAEAAAFREACERTGTPQAQVLKAAVQTFTDGQK